MMQWSDKGGNEFVFKKEMHEGDDADLDVGTQTTVKMDTIMKDGK